MLLQSMGHFKGWFNTDGVNIDDLPFKMHYGLTSVIILFSSLLVTGEAANNTLRLIIIIIIRPN